MEITWPWVWLKTLLRVQKNYVLSYMLIMWVRRLSSSKILSFNWINQAGLSLKRGIKFREIVKYLAKKPQNSGWGQNERLTLWYSLWLQKCHQAFLIIQRGKPDNFSSSSSIRDNVNLCFASYYSQHHGLFHCG